MKKIFISMFLFSVLLFMACSEDIVKPDAWPEWPTPSKPKIENVLLRGINGETTVAAGQEVKFTAQISDEYNDLISWQLLAAMGDYVVKDTAETLSGRSASIDIAFTIPFEAGFLNAPFVVTVKAVNNLASSTTELLLDQTASITVARPELPSTIYLVDNAGHVYEMTQASGQPDHVLQTTATNLAGIGSELKFTEKLTGGNQPDYSGWVWGYKDDRIVMNDPTAESIPTPLVAGYTLESISFDMLAFAIDKTVAFTVTINKSAMWDYTTYLRLENVTLVESANVVFVGFGDDVTNMLRPDLFKNISGTTAKFDGQTRNNYVLDYYVASGFLYTGPERNTQYPEAMWLLGSGYGFPRQPYAAWSVGWDIGSSPGFYFLKKISADVFEAPVYLANGFGFKFYTKYGWAFEETVNGSSHTAEPASLIGRPTGNDFMPGQDFTPGVYVVRIDMALRKVYLIPYN
jgi:hypothetical protein